MVLIMKTMPKNPRLPTAEFVTADMSKHGLGMVYGWKCDKYGISVYGNTAVEAKTAWWDAYQREYFS